MSAHPGIEYIQPKGPDIDESKRGKEGDTELDLTNCHLHSLEAVIISSSLLALDLTANRLKTIDERILALTGLRTVTFRQNLLHNISAWNDCQCKDVLEDMEFRDNELKEIPQLTGFSALKRAEFSYNEIKGLTNLSGLGATQLKELYVAANKVSSTQGISHFTSLVTLELGSNRIRTIEGLENLTLLQNLWLGRNRITQIKGLETLHNLKQLSIQSNRLESMLGLEGCTALEELYLSHNGIKSIEGISTLTNLRVLDVSNNRIEKVQNLESLHLLEDLWLNDNLIPELGAELQAALAPVSPTLTTIYLENNPAAKDPEYKAKLLQWLPHLTQLDSNPL